MSILNDILGELGLTGTRRTKRSKSPLPDFREIKDQAEKVINNLNELKNLPKTLMDRTIEAEEDFREADKAFRGTRLRKSGKK